MTAYVYYDIKKNIVYIDTMFSYFYLFIYIFICIDRWIDRQINKKTKNTQVQIDNRQFTTCC